jgi:hypothetical protein
MTDNLQSCHRCGSVDVRAADHNGRGICAPCFWKREGAWQVACLRAGLDKYGRPTLPPIPAGAPIGIMVYVAPRPYWPADFGLLECPEDRCGATHVGPIVGEPCPWCCDRARRAATGDAKKSGRKKAAA